MGSPSAPLWSTSIWREDFETKAINTAEYPPRIWKTYLDETFVVIDAAKKYTQLWLKQKKYAEILLCYRWLFIKGNVFIGEWGIFGADVFLHYS